MKPHNEDFNQKEGQNQVNKNLEKKSEGILDSLKDTKEDIGESITDKKEEIVSSIKYKKDGFSKSVGSGVKKTKSFLKKLFIGLFLLSILAFGLYMFYANWTYSEGSRAGDLIKISKKGYIFKTFEGQLKLGGIDLANSNDGLSDTWSFSVKDKNVIDKLEKLEGQKVVLKYKQINKAMPWQGETDYFIYEIQE